MTLTAVTEDDPFAAVERAVIKSRFLFAACDASGKHSSVWAAWDEGSDYYIGSRNISGIFKLSLHESGICRMAVSKEYKLALDQKGISSPAQDRALTKWRRPQTPATGAVHVASVIFPKAYYTSEAPRGTPKKPVFLMEAAPDVKAVEFGFFYSKHASKLETSLAKIGRPLIFSELANGESVAVVCRARNLDPIINFVGVPAGRPNLRSVLWNQPAEGGAVELISIGVS